MSGVSVSNILLVNINTHRYINSMSNSQNSWPKSTRLIKGSSHSIFIASFYCIGFKQQDLNIELKVEMSPCHVNQ